MKREKVDWRKKKANETNPTKLAMSKREFLTQSNRNTRRISERERGEVRERGREKGGRRETGRRKRWKGTNHCKDRCIQKSELCFSEQTH